MPLHAAVYNDFGDVNLGVGVNTAAQREIVPLVLRPVRRGAFLRISPANIGPNRSQKRGASRSLTVARWIALQEVTFLPLERRAALFREILNRIDPG